MLFGLVAVAAAKKPHLMFILVDDMGFNDFYTSSDLSAAWPNVAGLAKDECVKVGNYYTQPICTPTRGAFMSGRHPIRLGLQHGVITGYQDYGLPLDETTLADKLLEVGYNTIGVGKWHLGLYNNASTPVRRGFNHFYGYFNGAEDYLTHAIGGYLDLHDDDQLVKDKNGTYSSKLFADQIVMRIQEHKTKMPDAPLFVYFPLQNVHAPLEALDEYKNSKACASVPNADRKTFCGMARAADDAIGKVVNAMKTSFEGEDLLLIVSGDNGGMPGSAGNNCPDSKGLCLKGHKAELYEGGIRNNAVVCSKTLLPEAVKGTVYTKGLVHVMDWHATIRDLAGAKDGAKTTDGVSVWEAITQNKDSPRTEFLVNIDPCSGHGSCQGTEAAYRSGDWKLITGAASDTYYPVPTTTGSSQALPVSDNFGGWGGWSGTQKFPPSPAVDQLYNISADPGESTNLATTQTAVVAALKAKVAALGKEALAPCNIPDGACYSDDSKAQAVIDAHGGWFPWAEDPSYSFIV